MCRLLSCGRKFTILAVKQLGLFLLFAATALAQGPPYAYDCSKLSSPSAGCKSYNEMVIANDKQLLSSFRTNITFVCFRPYQDVFFTLSYGPSQYESFTKVASTSEYEAPAILVYVRYKDGVRDDVQ